MVGSKDIWIPSEKDEPSADILRYMILLVYYPKYLGVLAVYVKALIDKCSIVRLVVVVNNPDISVDALRDHFGFVGDGLDVVFHDNVGAEFGGYQLGLDVLRPKLDVRSAVLICNDTFCMHRYFSSEQLHELVKAIEARVPTARVIGNVQQLAVRNGVFGIGATRFVNSSIFALNWQAMSALEFRIYCPELNSLVVASPDPDLFFSPEISLSFRNQMRRWLFSSNGGWYGAADLSEKNCRQLAAKARAILQEAYISMRLDAAYVEFVDISPKTKWGKLMRRIKYMFFTRIVRLPYKT